MTHNKFWNKVNKTATCWLWVGAKSSNGYGEFWLAGRPQGAHRVAWQDTHGEIPGGLRVLHKCDTPLCVNPEHLFLGTAKDNMQDMLLKGRGFQKITKCQAELIKKDTRPRKVIAKEYGLHAGHVANIQLGYKW